MAAKRALWMANLGVGMRRSGEGEALGGRATAGRGRASGESSDEAMLWGSTAASDVSLGVSGGGARWSGNDDGSENDVPTTVPHWPDQRPQ